MFCVVFQFHCCLEAGERAGKRPRRAFSLVNFVLTFPV
jgi:hypothetical protein